MSFTALQFNANALYQAVNLDAHGYTAGQLIIPAAVNFQLSQSNTFARCGGTVIVSSVPDVNSFYFTQVGFVNNLPHDELGNPLVAGSIYYVSATTAGKYTPVAPTSTGDVFFPCLIAITATSGLFSGGYGNTIGSFTGFNWITIVAGQTLVPNQGLYVNAPGPINLALPTNAVEGDTYKIWDIGGNGFTITQAAGQSIEVGINTSTVGVAGNIVSTRKGNLITIVCLAGPNAFIADPGLASFTVN
jgi:hypothetical protein